MNNDKLFLWAFRAKDITGSGKLKTYGSWDGPVSDAYKKYILFSEYENQLALIRKEYEESLADCDRVNELLKRRIKELE